MNNNTYKLTIGGEERTLKWSMYALERMDDIPAAKSDAVNFIRLIWGGLCGAALTNEPGVTVHDVSDWVDELIVSDPKLLADVYKSFTDSTFYKTITKTVDDAAKKKKPTGAK